MNADNFGRLGWIERFQFRAGLPLLARNQEIIFVSELRSNLSQRSPHPGGVRGLAKVGVRFVSERSSNLSLGGESWHKSDSSCSNRVVDLLFSDGAPAFEELGSFLGKLAASLVQFAAAIYKVLTGLVEEFLPARGLLHQPATRSLPGFGRQQKRNCHSQDHSAGKPSHNSPTTVTFQ
jgi:hypothetical protein